MKNFGPYLIAIVCLTAITVLGYEALQITSNLERPVLGKIKYIWIGGFIFLGAVIGFFIWLFTKEK